jgi:hypothetical protein
MIPKYTELNHLIIIDGIGIEKENDIYTIYLREIIPIKDNNSIKYEYKYYKEKDNDINKAINKINDKTNKKLYLEKIKFLVTNSNDYKSLKIKFKNIYKTNDVYQELKTNYKNK